MSLKAGKSSTEWWTIVGVIGFAVAKQFGIIPQEVTEDMVAATTSSELLPYIFDRIMNLAQSNSNLLVAAGLAWAFLKRRAGLKSKEIDVNAKGR